MTTNTDAVRVLREALKYWVDIHTPVRIDSSLDHHTHVCLTKSREALAATEPAEHGFTCICDACCKPAERAAIQPAGEMLALSEVSRILGDVRSIYFDTPVGVQVVDYIASILTAHAAPVSAPVPEAKAEQPGAHHLTAENIAAVIADLQSIEDGTTERPIEHRDMRTQAGIWHRIMAHLMAAPAVKHEASELEQRLRTIYVAYNGHGEELKGIGDEAADALAACQTPSIAMPAASIGDDAEFINTIEDVLLDTDLGTDKRERATARIVAAIDRYIDARSHVAAAPTGYALVPLRPNLAMQRVMDEDSWQWEDLLASADAITEQEYNELAAVPTSDVLAEVERKEVHGAICVFINRTPHNRDIPHGTKLIAQGAAAPDTSARDADKRDAERYRWLRDPDNCCGPNWLASKSPEELDAAIDAAMQAQQKEGEG